MADNIARVQLEAAEATKRALVEVAIRAYEAAGLSGLCEEGRWEAALGAMKSYEISQITKARAIGSC